MKMKFKYQEYITNKVIGNAISMIIAIVFFVFITNFDKISGAMLGMVRIIAPFIYAFVLAYLLNRPIMWLQTNCFYKLGEKTSKSLSIFVAYIVFFILMLALGFAIIPQAVDTLMSIVDNLPMYIENVTTSITGVLSKYELGDDVSDEIYTAWRSISQFLSAIDIDSILSKILSASISVGNVIIDSITAVIASIYMHSTKDTLIMQLKKIMYSFAETSKVEAMLVMGRRVDKIFSGFIIGKMIDSVIIGCICFIGMMFIYYPFALLIAVIIGVTNMIPYFGPFIGAIPSGVILLTVSPMTTIIFVAFILVLQQVDGNIIGPKILGDSTGLSAFWVLVAIIVGGELLGIVGMIIGVPAFAVVYSVASEIINNILQKKDIKLDNQGLLQEIEKPE